MTRLLFYPHVANEGDMADILSRANWHFSPYLKNVESLTVYSAVSRRKAFGADAPFYLDPLSAPSKSSDAFKDKVKIESSRRISRKIWTEAFKNTDQVIVWRMPGFHPQSRKNSEIFEDLKALQAELPNGVTMIVADRHARPSEASLLLSAGLRLHGDLDAMAQEHHRKFLTFAETINKDRCHILGTGPSLAELDHYDLSDGDVISCNSLVINDELMEALKPKVICAADPIFHAGPSSYAAAFRAGLIEKMGKYDFHLFVPQRDYLIYMHCIPQAYHSRVIAVPLGEDSINLDLKSEFRVEPLPNVLTLLMIPIGASAYTHLTVSGCDGRPLDENQYFWGHHKASQINDKMEDIKIAHPGFFNISYDDYYERHCEQVEDLCAAFERSGGTISPLTASYVPALRKRGAAEPLRQVRVPDSDAPLTVLSLNPDLVDSIGHFWNYEEKLAPEFTRNGMEYRVASNNAILDNFDVERGSDGTIFNDGVCVDPILTTNSFTLANRTGVRIDKVEDVAAATMAEFENAIDRARAAARGEVLVYLYTGSLEHLEVLNQLLFDRPDVCVVVNLFWTKAVDIWQSDFATKYGWLLQQVQCNPRLNATAMTAHQARAIRERTGVSLEVARHPSPLIGDDKARKLLASQPAKSTRKKKLSIFFPSANRVEKGSTILGSIAENLAVMLHSHDYEFVFRADPAKHGDVSMLKSVTGGYRVMEGSVVEDAFIAALAEADVVVLPYLPPDFSDRTSGLTIDAAFAGTPVVVMAGTWLAECAQEYGIGTVVDIPTPDKVARATYDLLVGPPSASINVKAGAKRYFDHNNWTSLATEIREGATIPASTLWGEDKSRVIAERNESIAPLLGQVHSSNNGRVDIPQLLQALVGDDKFTGLDIIGLGGLGLVSKILEFDKPLNVIAENPYLAGLLATTSKPIGEHISIGFAPEGEINRAYTASIGGKRKHNTFASFGVDANQYKALKNGLKLAQYEALSIGFISPFGERPMEFAMNCSGWLEAEGYTVMVAEHWYRPDSFAHGPIRRVVTYPYVSAIPYAPATIFAVKRPISTTELKRLFNEHSENCEYVERATNASMSAKLWRTASLPSPEKIALQRPAPAKKIWDLEGFEAVSVQKDGFVTIAEHATERVHRASTVFQANQGEALTVQCDVRYIKTRYVVLWVTDAKFKPIAEATFDIANGKFVSSKAPSALIAGDTFAGIARLDENDNTAWHIWMSLPKINTSDTLLCSLVTRSTASGSVRFMGSQEREIGVRNLAVTYLNEPSIFSGQAIQSLVKALPKAQKKPTTETSAKASVVVPKNVTPPPAASSVSKPSVAASVKTDAAKKSELPDEDAGYKVEAEFHALGLAEDDATATSWRSNDVAEIRSSSDGLSVKRNGGGHADQCYLFWDLDPQNDHKIILKLEYLSHKLIILLNGREFLVANEAGKYTLPIPSRLSRARFDIKVVESTHAEANFSEITLKSRRRVLA